MLRGNYDKSIGYFIEPLPLQAQDITQNENGEFIGTVTLGESRRGVQTSKAVSETVINQAEIDARQATTTAELLDTIPNVSLNNQSIPHGASVSIRGLGAQSGTYATDGKVAVVVNGVVSSSEEIYRNGASLALEPELFKQITVQRGPAESFRFSSGAMGGTIEARTKSARDFLSQGDIWSVRQKLGYESNGNSRLSSTILSFAPDQKLDVIGFYGYREAKDRTDGAGNAITSTDFVQKSSLLEANYQIDDTNRVTVHGSHNALPQFDVPYSAFSDTFSDVNVDRLVEDTTVFIEYSHNPLNNDLLNLAARLTLKQEKMRISSVSDASDIYNTDHNNTRLAVRVNNEAFFQMGDVGHTVNAGVEWSDRERSSRELAGDYAGYNARSAPGGTDRSISAYVLDEIRLGGLTVTPQLRFESQTLTSENNDYSYINRGTKVDAVADGTQHDYTSRTGALAVRYELTDGFAVSGTAAYNQNLPILDDMRSATNIVQAETGQTIELGASYNGFDVLSEGDAIKTKLTLFKTEIRDVTSYFSLDSVDLDGGEIELSYAHTAFYADFNFGRTRGTVDGTDAYFNYAPADQVQLTVGKRLLDEQLDLAAELRHARANARTSTDPDLSRNVGSGTLPSDAYTVVNLSTAFTPKSGAFEGLRFWFAIDNVLEEEYRPYLTTKNAIGRNIKFAVAKQF